MSWLEFIERLVAHLAWPVAAVVIFLSLRKQLLERMNKLQKVKYGGAELEFAASVKEVVGTAKDVGLTLLYPDAPPVSSDDLQVAVIQRWAEIEGLLHSWKSGGDADAFAPSPPQAGVLPRPSAVIDELEAEQIIDRNLGSLLRQLRQVRNAAAHSARIDIPASERNELLGSFRSVVVRLKNTLEAARKTPQH